MNPLELMYEDMTKRGMTLEQYQEALRSAVDQQPNSANNLNVATGSSFSDSIMQMLLGILSGKLSASEMAGYLPGNLLGMEGTLPTLARQQYQTGTMFDLADLLGNPRDAAQLQYLSQLAGGGDPFAMAQSTNTPLTGEGWETLIDNLTGQAQTPTPTPVPTPTPTPTAPTDYITQRALDRYAASTAGEKAALAKATPEELQRLWAGGTARMAQGGQMRINEPSVILGLLSGQPHAMLGEGGKPENVKVSPVRKFAKGGNLLVGQAPRSAGDLATMLSQSQIPLPGAMRQGLYSQLLPYQQEALMGGVSAAGIPPESYLAQMQKYWHRAPAYPTVRYSW
jgi:hypothetical protein